MKETVACVIDFAGSPLSVATPIKWALKGWKYVNTELFSVALPYSASQAFCNVTSLMQKGLIFIFVEEIHDSYI